MYIHKQVKDLEEKLFFVFVVCFENDSGDMPTARNSERCPCWFDPTDLLLCGVYVPSRCLISRRLRNRSARYIKRAAREKWAGESG